MNHTRLVVLAAFASADGTSACGHFNPTGQPHGPRVACGVIATH